MAFLEAVYLWTGYSLLGTIFGALSLIFAFLAARRAKKASIVAENAVSLFSAFDAVGSIGSIVENLKSARHEIRGKDWKRVSENLETAQLEVVRLLSADRVSLGEKRTKLETVLDLIKRLARSADAAEERGMAMDTLKSKQTIELILHELISIQEYLKGHARNE
ncbi:hypothetical protein [Ruegeria sp. HKCCA5491]|uniref:hypothetical protein n=1 Tax=Ruegeria sp. HKCCA5491 TaxID=2682986 RepID=UPI001488193C|nr:hypothetical protein [Ruegeria sp. HKCCA5491]